MKKNIARIKEIRVEEFLKILNHKLETSNKTGKRVDFSISDDNIEEICVQDSEEPIARVGYEEITIRFYV